jgi:integrase-like protein
MGRRGSALDNPACESVMATFRTELVNRRSFHTPDQAREHVFRWIEGWYNPRRRYSSLGYLSPEAYESTHQIGGQHATTNGRAAPADPDQPALPEGALIGIGNPTRPNENAAGRLPLTCSLLLGARPRSLRWRPPSRSWGGVAVVRAAWLP